MRRGASSVASWLFAVDVPCVYDHSGALKVASSDGVTIRRERTWRTAGPQSKNGAYGIYPVLCSDVLIEHSVAECASDAGIYVGQSERVIVRHCRAEQNVAGIDIESVIGADGYQNVAANNTGEMPAFPCPGSKSRTSATAA